MIDYSEIKSGQKLRITGMGAPGFAKLGDVVTVENCTADNNGRCDVVHDETGKKAFFALTCGAQRLEAIPISEGEEREDAGSRKAYEDTRDEESFTSAEVDAALEASWAARHNKEGK